MQFPHISSDIIQIKVTPGSKKDEYIDTLPDGTMKIRLKASPTDGKANIALLNFLKKETNIEWEIKSGFTTSRKILKKK
jgi:uncharacterized protein (TIGR00251 family)